MTKRPAFTVVAALVSAFAASSLSGQTMRRPPNPFGAAFEAFTTSGSRAPATPRRTQFGPEVTDYVARTSDNWKLVVHRYRSANRQDRSKLPVILCHGFSYNATFFDLTPDASFARYLANEGYDVWVVNLRGAGQSSRWALTTPAAGNALLGRLAAQIDGSEIPRYGFVSIDPKYANWTFDDHVERDIPAILSLVKHRTNRPQVAWIGHSMGGNIMLAYLSRYGQDPSVGKLVVIGSQLRLPPESAFGELLLTTLEQRQREVTANAPLLRAFSAGANRMFFNEANMTQEAFRAIETSGQDSPSVGVLEQYLTLCARGEMLDASKRTSYVTGLRNVQCPSLIVGGAADRIAPPYLQERLLRDIGAENRLLLILGKQNGFSVDFGHCDAIVGRQSLAEVYPVLSRWLDGQPIGLTASPR